MRPTYIFPNFWVAMIYKYVFIYINKQIIIQFWNACTPHFWIFLKFIQEQEQKIFLNGDTRFRVALNFVVHSIYLKYVRFDWFNDYFTTSCGSYALCNYWTISLKSWFKPTTTKKETQLRLGRVSNSERSL